MGFVAIDVETSDGDSASICQIGIAGYKDGNLVYEWESLIKPDEYFSFDPFNIEIHGITEKMVIGAPSFRDVYQEIKAFLSNNIVICHTHFDRTSLSRASHFYGLDPINCTWLDSAQVARRTWRQFARKGYALKNVCDFLGYEFAHHNALADAKAAGFIMLEACRYTGLSIEDWM